MIVAPSFLTADFSRLKSEIESVSSASWLHFDVMDGHFVENKTYDESIVSEVRQYSSQFFDVHLMIQHPDNHVQKYIQSGAQSVTFHIEAEQLSVRHTIEKIHEMNCEAGISIKPGTPVEELVPYLKEIELVLIMSVEPGKGGQKFLTSALDKIRFLDHYRKQHYLSFWIEVDGGINDETIEYVKTSGADVVVVGSYLFNQTDRNDRIEVLERGA